MSRSRWVVVSSLCVGIGISCAEAEDQHADLDDTRDGGSSGNSGANKGGKSNTGGSSPQGGSSGSSAGGKSGSGTGGKAGTSTGGVNHAGTATAGGKAGTPPVEEGGAPSNGGSNAGGTGSTGLGCVVEAAGGVATTEGGAANAGAAGETSAAGEAGTSGSAGAGTGSLPLFTDDFETGSASKWTTAGGTWALVDDGSKVYEQSLLENKLQLAVVSELCLADQVIEARVKVTEFKGQSSSYVAALFGRVLGPQTHYFIALGSDKKLILRKRINSTSTSATAIGSAVTFTTTPDQWYDVRFELIGTTLKGCVGDVCVSGTDTAISSGSVALGTVNTSAHFDDVRVTTP